MQQGKKFLSDLKLYSDYLKWNDNESKYETWEDACESIINGHRKHYEGINIEDILQFSKSLMKEKVILASQRNLQYRYEQIKSHNERLYNCSSMYASRNRIFQEVLFLALSGCGVGIGKRDLIARRRRARGNPQAVRYGVAGCGGVCRVSLRCATGADRW